jgi:hypothetical protein
MQELERICYNHGEKEEKRVGEEKKRRKEIN